MYLSGLIGVAALAVAVPLTVVSIAVMPVQTIPVLVLAGLLWWLLYARKRAREKPHRDLMTAEFNEIGRKYQHWLRPPHSEVQDDAAARLTLAERRELHRIARGKVESRETWTPPTTERGSFPRRLPRDEVVDLTAWDDPGEDPDYEGD